MENAAHSCPFPRQLKDEDRAVFERVWRRVMPEERADSPIEVEESGQVTFHGGDLPCTCLCPCSSLPVPAEAVREERGGHLGCDFPDGGDVPRLGQSSAVYGARLQEQIRDAVDCWQGYRALARRAGGGGCARTLSSLASDAHRAARRLAAAYFLISGVRWWPAHHTGQPVLPSFQGVLRENFRQEQRRAQAYLTAADDTRDEALQELYRDLAEMSRSHSETLRTLVEQSGF